MEETPRVDFLLAEYGRICTDMEVAGLIKLARELERDLIRAQAIIEQQKETFMAALDNATKMSAKELKLARQLKLKSGPRALESEREANAILTDELEKAQAEIEWLKQELRDNSALAAKQIIPAEMAVEDLQTELQCKDKLIERMGEALRLAKLSGKMTMSAVAWQVIESALNTLNEGKQ